MAGERRSGHCLTRPIAVRGAVPGQVLAVRFIDNLRQRNQRGLRDRVADARVQFQAFISNAVIAPGGKAHQAETPAVARAPSAVVSGERGPCLWGRKAPHRRLCLYGAVHGDHWLSMVARGESRGHVSPTGCERIRQSLLQDFMINFTARQPARPNRANHRPTSPDGYSAGLRRV